MRNITQILKYGQTSFSKARRVKTGARRNVADYFAFTIKSSRADGPRYIVRIAKEGRHVLAECVNAVTGEPCEGFHHMGHCYHLAKALRGLVAKRAAFNIDSDDVMLAQIQLLQGELGSRFGIA